METAELEGHFWGFLDALKPSYLGQFCPREVGLQRTLVNTVSELYDYYVECVRTRQSGYISLFSQSEIQAAAFYRIFVDVDFPFVLTREDAAEKAFEISDLVREKMGGQMISAAVYSGNRGVHLYLDFVYELTPYVEFIVDELKLRWAEKGYKTSGFVDRYYMFHPVWSVAFYKSVSKAFVRWLFEGTEYVEHVDWGCVGDVRRMVRLPGTFGKTSWCSLLWRGGVSVDRMKLTEVLVNELRDAVVSGIKRWFDTSVKPSERGEAFRQFLDLPPCVAEMVAELVQTGELDHYSRFHVAAYLLQNGWSKNDVVDVFRAANDFKEHVTRYQVEHIARNQYKPYSCRSLAAFGRCPYKCQRFSWGWL